MADTLLTYAVSTDPNPLQASPATGDPVAAELTVVVSNNTRKLINCASISFTILVGENAKDLTAGASGIRPMSRNEGWSIQQSGSGGVFTATPKTPDDGKIGESGLAFTLSGVKVNRQPGTSILTVTEVASQPQGSPPAPQQTRTTTLPLGKFPPHFTVGELTASPPVVTEGGSTTLSWSGSSGATYTLQYGDKVINKTKDGQPLPATGSYTVDDLQENPTIFYLIVTYQQSGGSGPVVQRNCPVTVETVTINAFVARPAVVGVNGVTQLSWRTKNATSCTLDPGNHTVPPNGHIYVVVAQTQFYTLTANGARPDPTPPQLQRAVTVDPAIVPTKSGPTYFFSGANGPDGPNGPGGDPYGGSGANGRDGMNVGNGTIEMTMPLDTSSTPSVVSLIRMAGGNGGRGGDGGNGTRQGGRGGDGGNGGDTGDLTVIFKPANAAPTQYIIENVGGKLGRGGKAGSGGNPPSPNGCDGRDGHPGRIILLDNDPDKVAAELDVALLSGASDAEDSVGSE